MIRLDKIEVICINKSYIDIMKNTIKMVGFVVDSLADWLVDRLVGWLVGSLVG